MVADGEAQVVRPDFDDFDTEFVSDDSGVVEERLATSKRVQVRAADTHAMYADQGVTVRGARLRRVCHGEAAWLLENDCLHASPGCAGLSGCQQLNMAA